MKTKIYDYKNYLKNEKGSVFLSAIAILLGFTVFLASHSLIATSQLQQAFSDQKILIAREKAKSGIYIALDRIIKAKKENSLVLLLKKGRTSFFLEDESINIKIEEESGKLNIRDIGNDELPNEIRMPLVLTFFNLLEKLGVFVESGDAGKRELMRKILVIKRIHTISDLVYNKIISRSTLFRKFPGTNLRLIDVITVSGYWKIELNSASVPVISSIPHITGDIAKKVLAAQWTTTDEKNMTSLIAIGQRILVKAKPSLFKIVSTSVYNKISRTYEAIMEFDGDIPRFYYFSELTGN